jgi:hypothetical protein
MGPAGAVRRESDTALPAGQGSGPVKGAEGPGFIEPLIEGDF